MKNKKDILDQIRQLSTSDRIQLIQDAWDDISNKELDSQIDDDLKAELNRRLDKLEANPNTGTPWEDFKKTALDRMRNK